MLSAFLKELRIPFRKTCSEVNTDENKRPEEDKG